ESMLPQYRNDIVQTLLISVVKSQKHRARREVATVASCFEQVPHADGVVTLRGEPAHVAGEGSRTDRVLAECVGRPRRHQMVHENGDRLAWFVNPVALIQ